MRKRNLGFMVMMIAILSISLLAFAPKSSTEKKKNVTGTIQQSNVGINGNVTAYRYTAVGFTGATYYIWYYNTGGSNVVFGGNGSSAVLAGDGSCDPVTILVKAFPDCCTGPQLDFGELQSDLCTPY